MSGKILVFLTRFFEKLTKSTQINGIRLWWLWQWWLWIFILNFSLISIHAGLCKLRNLKNLDVASNLFGGSIPWCFGNMNHFNTLYLSHNQFRGTIPSSMFRKLKMLTTISISNNQLSWKAECQYLHHYWPLKLKMRVDIDRPKKW